MLIWLKVEPGIVKDIAFNVMVIGGVSTVLFNGNPLLRYDAYYILSDFIGIPNLANRSNKYIGFLILRHIFGVKDAQSPVKSDGEPVWLFVYGIASFCYRMFILFFIVLFISNQYFFVGMALGVWIIVLQLVIPLAKNIAFVITDLRIKNHSFRTWISIIGFFALFYQIFFNVSVPYATVAEGVVWLDDNTQVRTNNDGFITKIHVNNK